MKSNCSMTLHVRVHANTVEQQTCSTKAGPCASPAQPAALPPYACAHPASCPLGARRCAGMRSTAPTAQQETSSRNLSGSKKALPGSLRKARSQLHTAPHSRETSSAQKNVLHNPSTQQPISADWCELTSDECCLIMRHKASTLTPAQLPVSQPPMPKTWMPQAALADS